MILNKLKLIIFFIQTINHSICEVDLNNITEQNVQTLQRDYQNIMQRTIQNQPYYIKQNNGVMYYPVPYSHAVNYTEVPYEGIGIINRKLNEVVNNCVYEKKYALAYIIILNAIESIGLTYMYRFCEFAIEMNKKGASISYHLKQFSKNLRYKIVPIFNREWISPIPYDCMLNVYKKHECNHENYKFTNVDEVYMSDLLDCKNLMKDKINLIREPRVKSINNIIIDELTKTQEDNDEMIKLLLPDGFGDKDIIGYKNQTFCPGCNKIWSSGVIDVICIFLSCGHGWSCECCSENMTQCPVCHEEITGTQDIHIKTPTRIMKKDGREARCMSCHIQINDVDPPTKHVVIPCGHGWYCSQCIDNFTNCILCDQNILSNQCVNL
ncbi:uncharacterized protein LOC126894372 isoform X4 [Daktulosphaira vitifoliae]|uniref:uncharacterized protein LOC126894372 isoform X4 n=1 Tax=Daktulosphaira vitifoliae TaxID=58002 RepID=UPI0021AAAC10|nr:uncharacterized protein LOC126894372 isoform X4 [Daktulosphaira vitifoliae]